MSTAIAKNLMAEMKLLGMFAAFEVRGHLPGPAPEVAAR